MAKLSYTNIFDAVTKDAGEAADLEFRSDMMVLLRKLFEAKGWAQADVMRELGIPQPRVSELVTGKIDKVSSDKLIRYLAQLGYSFKPTYKESRKLPVRCDVEERCAA